MLRSARNYDRNAASRAAGLGPFEESRTVQSDAQEADINVIVARFGLTGLMPQNVRPPIEADFVDIYDFHSAMQAMRAATESFDSMPAKVRERFNNDPGLFVDFCLQEKDGKLANLEEMRKLGLAVDEVKPLPEVIQKVEVINPTPAA